MYTHSHKKGASLPEREGQVNIRIEKLCQKRITRWTHYILLQPIIVEHAHGDKEVLLVAFRKGSSYFMVAMTM